VASLFLSFQVLSANEEGEGLEIGPFLMDFYQRIWILLCCHSVFPVSFLLLRGPSFSSFPRDGGVLSTSTFLSFLLIFV